MMDKVDKTLLDDYANFRSSLRYALYAVWPNNPGVNDHEIVEAVERLAQEEKNRRIEKAILEEDEQLKAPDEWDWDKAETKPPVAKCFDFNVHVSHDWYTDLSTKFQKLWYCPGVEKKIVKELPIEQCPRLGVEKRKHLAHIWDIDCVTPADQRSRWCPGP